MTKKSNIKTRYEQRIDELEQALDFACEMLSKVMPQEMLWIQTQFGTFYKDKHEQKKWIMERVKDNES